MNNKNFDYISLKKHPLCSNVEYSDKIMSLSFQDFILVPRDGNCLYSSLILSIYLFLLRDLERKKKSKFYRFIQEYECFICCI